MDWQWVVPDSEEFLTRRMDVTILSAYCDGLGGVLGSTEGERPPLSRSRLQKLIDEGQVTVDGQSVPASFKLLAGQAVRLSLPAPRPLELQPENRPLDILFEDEHLVVVNKPAGLTVHPSETQHDGTLVHALLHHVRDLSGIGGVLRPGIVHRLDKDTSGALVVSKTDLTHQKLVEIFAAHAIERRYWALCYGTRSPGETTLTSTIGRNPSDRKKMAMNVKGGRNAITHFRGIENYGTHSCWIEARLETGRTHQVRVHLTSEGNALLGDPVYGVPSSRSQKWLSLPVDVRRHVDALQGQALHARILAFRHPVTGADLRFEAEPPQAWLALRDALRDTSPK